MRHLRDLGYRLLKYWVRSGLYCYYGNVKITGKDTIPKDLPVLFLPNHQSALMDVLLLAVDCGRKPWFLTRSDVFGKPLLKRFFAYLQMIPIYRIRDGRGSLKNNEAIFRQCAELLYRNEAILMFPEANHNLERRVRPLSKGFTRILVATLDRFPHLDIQIIPVGLNYRDAKGFPDQVAIKFGEPIPAKDLWERDDLHGSKQRLKEEVSGRMKELTTHIDDKENYHNIAAALDTLGIDYLYPERTNAVIEKLKDEKGILDHQQRKKGYGTFFKPFFTVLNLPLVMGWRYGVKPKIWEPEFTATLRFWYAMLAAPLYYTIVFVIMALLLSPLIGVLMVIGLFLFNWLYVKSA